MYCGLIYMCCHFKNNSFTYYTKKKKDFILSENYEYMLTNSLKFVIFLLIEVEVEKIKNKTSVHFNTQK